MWPGTGTCAEGFATQSQNRGASPEGRDSPSKGRCTCGSDPTNRHCWWPRRVDRGHRTRRHRNRVGGHTRDNSRICGSTRAGGCRNCRPAAIHVFAAGIGVERLILPRYTYLPPGLVWNLATLPPRYLPPGLVWNWATLPPRICRPDWCGRFPLRPWISPRSARSRPRRQSRPHAASISTHCSPPR